LKLATAVEVESAHSASRQCALHFADC